MIIFRKNISGITQRLGEISLKKDEDQEIDSISWAATAVTRSTDLEVEVKDLRGKYEEQGRMIEKLNQQLESLIQAKIEHENGLLEKFRELLNAKKSKIRDLHRALAGVKMDPQNGKTHCVEFRTASTKPILYSRAIPVRRRDSITEVTGSLAKHKAQSQGHAAHGDRIHLHLRRRGID